MPEDYLLLTSLVKLRHHDIVCIKERERLAKPPPPCEWFDLL
jgi:hypothetical protein